MQLPEGFTKEDQAAWNRLRRRMPGIEADMERVVQKMAVMQTGRGRTRIHYEEKDGGYVAFIEVISLLFDEGREHVRFPVVPDHANPNENKIVTREMEPHLFTNLIECRQVAEEAEITLLRAMRAAESAALAEE